MSTPNPSLNAALLARLGYAPGQDPKVGPPRTGEVTPLPPEKVPQFVEWLIRNRVRDLDASENRYDYRGAFLAGVGRDPGDEGHFPDTYKQHGHPTFSDESIYSRGYGDGGHWIGETYIPEQRVVGSRVTLPPVITRAPRPRR